MKTVNGYLSRQQLQARHAPLVDSAPIRSNGGKCAVAPLLCNGARRGGRPAPNGSLLVRTFTFPNVLGHTWINSIFQLPQPVATTDTPPKKKRRKLRHRPQRAFKLLITPPSPPTGQTSCFGPSPVSHKLLFSHIVSTYVSLAEHSRLGVTREGNYGTETAQAARRPQREPPSNAKN